MRCPAIALSTALLLVLPAEGHARPHCAGPVEIADGRLLRVEKNGAIILTDGRALHLEGIRLPAGAVDRAPQSFVDDALAAVTALVRSGPMTLTAMPPKEDRYDRVRVQAFEGDRWIQNELLSHGLARVLIAPDRTECAAELFAAEAKARAAHVGLWASAPYAVRNPQNVWRDIGTFQIVEGKVLNASVKNGRAYLNFGADWRTDFTVTVDPADRSNFRQSGVDPTAYVGQTIRVRGWVQSLNGPEIEVPNPQGIEVIQ
jgi:micrococcal nuclease